MNGARAQSTIVAIATPPGKGAIAIVRASGPAVENIRRVMIAGAPALRPRTATYVTVCDEGGRPLDRALALYFPAPQTYTGEAMLELHLHGSPVVARDVASAMLACGARLAAPGSSRSGRFSTARLRYAKLQPSPISLKRRRAPRRAPHWRTSMVRSGAKLRRCATLSPIS